MARKRKEKEELFLKPETQEGGFVQCERPGCWYDATGRERECYFHDKVTKGFIDHEASDVVDPLRRLLTEWDVGRPLLSLPQG